MMQYFAVMWLLWTRVAGSNLQLHDGDELKLQIDPTNKENIIVRVDGKEQVVINLVKPSPTLAEIFKLPNDLITGEQDSPATGFSSAEKGPHQLRELFAEKSFTPKNLGKFDGQKFQQQVESYARELRQLIDEHKSAENIDGVFSESLYQEDKIRDFFERSKQKWENDPNAKETMRKTPIVVAKKEFEDFFVELRKQKHGNNPQFDVLEEYIKTIMDYNSNIFNRENQLI